MILFPLPTNTSLHYLCSLELSEKKAATISSCKELLNPVPFSQVSPCKIIEQATFWWTFLFPGDLTTVAPFIFSIIFQTYQDIRFPWHPQGSTIFFDTAFSPPWSPQYTSCKESNYAEALITDFSAATLCIFKINNVDHISGYELQAIFLYFIIIPSILPSNTNT